MQCGCDASAGATQVSGSPAGAGPTLVSDSGLVVHLTSLFAPSMLIVWRSQQNGTLYLYGQAHSQYWHEFTGCAGESTGALMAPGVTLWVLPLPLVQWVQEQAPLGGLFR